MVDKDDASLMNSGNGGATRGDELLSNTECAVASCPLLNIAG